MATSRLSRRKADRRGNADRTLQSACNLLESELIGARPIGSDGAGHHQHRAADQHEYARHAGTLREERDQEPVKIALNLLHEYTNPTARVLIGTG